eukprot:2539528-Pleurochrysis_carterae.AAC.1
MEKMLHRIYFTEQLWHDTDSLFSWPENKLRLKQQLRSCKLKCEFADEVPVSEAISMLRLLRKKATATAAADSA